MSAVAAAPAFAAAVAAVTAASTPCPSAADARGDSTSGCGASSNVLSPGSALPRLTMPSAAASAHTRNVDAVIGALRLLAAIRSTAVAYTAPLAPPTEPSPSATPRSRSAPCACGAASSHARTNPGRCRHRHLMITIAGDAVRGHQGPPAWPRSNQRAKDAKYRCGDDPGMGNLAATGTNSPA